MNCKGIIEKYKKTNPVFNVCLFNVKSTLGQGSRFYFRLPAGVRRVLTAILLVFSLGMVSCSKATDNDVPKETLTDSLTLALQAEYELLLNKASDYANEAYYCNVDGGYALALQYIDSAMVCLNEHYGKYAEEPHRYMTLVGDDIPAELDWWNEMFNSDFHVILDIRNEAAVAFLALKQWDEYGYNNAAYTTLYKLLGEDQSLEDFCRELERSTNNKTVSILLVIILLVTLCLGYYVLYFRRRLVNRWNLEQVLEINKQVFTASVISASEDEEMLKREEDMLKDIPQQIADNAFDAVNELLSIERLSIAVYNEAAHRLEYASNPLEGVAENKLVWEDLMQCCFEEQRYLSENGMQALPLIVKAGNSTQCIGVLCLVRSRMQQESDRLLLELIARYIAIVIFNAVVKLAMKYRDIETAQDEARRASWEDSLLHVQNMVLDNCLSTVKHETIYYPNRIKQLIGKLRSGKLSETEEWETVAAISELIEYYKGVFYILSQCASRQLEEVTFRRTVIPVPELLEAAEKYFRKVSRGVAASVVFSIETVSESVIGDVNQLHFLLENLIDEALFVPVAGKIRLTCAVEDDFVRFLFTDMRREKTRKELNQLFYPNLVRMTAGEKGKLCGTEYLLCKQIIRDHDEFAGRRGCRINAEPAEKGGFAVYFTLPRYLKRIQPGR